MGAVDEAALGLFAGAADEEADSELGVVQGLGAEVEHGEGLLLIVGLDPGEDFLAVVAAEEALAEFYGVLVDEEDEVGGEERREASIWDSPKRRRSGGLKLT